MTTPTIKLVKGIRTLDLNSGDFHARTNWAPPAPNEVPLLAEGTSANRSGPELIDRRPMARTTDVPLNVTGSSEADVTRNLRVLDYMLRQAGDVAEPLYLYFLGNSDAPEPLWGNYGVPFRYEIITGRAEIEPTYMAGARMNSDVDVTLALMIKPYALGKAQRLASAIGGVLEDTLGTADGLSRGLIVPEVSPTGGNQFTNPVFGAATWNTGWTAGANVNAAQNTDPQFVIFGLNSVKLTCFTTPTATYFQSINLGSTATHVVSCIARKRDGSAITAADAKVYYAGDLTTTYQVMTNGWYRLWASFTGIASAQNVGISLQAAGVELFCDMFQVERAAYPTAPMYGDLLGCAWSGTAHASATTRTAGRIRLPVADAWNQGGITIRMAVRFDVPNTHPNNMVLWSRTGGATVFAQFNATGDTFQVTDGTNTGTSAAQTIAAGDIVILHFTLGAGGMIIYKAGASIATATYTRSSITVGTDYLYLGSGSGAGSQIVGAILGVDIWDRELTAAQVVSDYANASQLTADGRRVSAVPWLWTKDGDDVVDNCDDSTRDNWAVVGGVPGTAPADTEYKAVHSATFGSLVDISIWALNNFLHPSGLYCESTGSADANASGGSVQVTSIDSSSEVSITALTLVPSMAFYGQGIAGREFAGAIRVKDAGANLKFRLRFSGGITLYGDYKAGVVSTHTNLLCPAIVFPRINTSELDLSGYWVINISGIRTTGGASNVTSDYFMLMPRPLATVSIGDTVSVWRGDSYEKTGSGGVRYERGQIQGDVLDVFPNVYNVLLFSAHGENAAPSDNSVAATTTLSWIKVTPRYALL